MLCVSTFYQQLQKLKVRNKVPKNSANENHHFSLESQKTKQNRTSKTKKLLGASHFLENVT